MRILWLCSYAPYPPDFGGARRTYNLLEQAARAGHEIDLLALATGAPERTRDAWMPCAASGRTSNWCATPAALPAALGAATRRQWPASGGGNCDRCCRAGPTSSTPITRRAMQAALDRRAAAVPYDLVQVEFSQMAYYRLPAGVPAVLDLHNVEYEDAGPGGGGRGAPLRRLYNWAEYLKFRRAEPQLWRRFALLLVTSERDGALVRQTGRRRARYGGAERSGYRVFPPAPPGAGAGDRRRSANGVHRHDGLLPEP